MNTELQLDKSNWKPVTFGDVVSEVRKSTKDPVADGIERVVGLEHIEPECIHLRSWASIDEETTFTKTFEKGHVLFGRRRAYLKKAAQPEFKGICSGDITVMEAKDGLIPELLPFLVCNDKFFDYAVQHSAGGLSPRTKFKDLANYEFLLPPKDKQAKMAELLWAADAATEAHRYLHTQSEQFQASRTRDLLTASGEEKTTKCKLGSIPNGWKCLSLQELLDSGAIVSHLDGNHGSDYPRNEEFVGSGVPYISANSIESGTVDFSKSKYLTTERAAKIRKGVAKDGDVLLAHNATVGPTCELKTEEEKVILGTSLTYYRVDPEKISSAYLLSYMKSRFFQQQLEQVMNQSTRNQVPITTQRKLLFLVPPRSQQDLVAETVENLSKPITSAFAAMEASHQLFKSLINQMF